MKRIFAIPLMALVLLVSYMTSAHAISLGWNVIRPTNCLGYQLGGLDYLFIYTAGGSYVYTYDSVMIVSAVPFCASGQPFYLYTPDGVHATLVSVYPGLK